MCPRASPKRHEERWSPTPPITRPLSTDARAVFVNALPELASSEALAASALAAALFLYRVLLVSRCEPVATERAAHGGWTPPERR
jgi:hypothetical protein